MRVALVLGSGGARGYAHIGVIDELKARGHEIVAISGTSMGALVGGLEAASRLEEFTDWATKLSQLGVLRHLDIAWRGGGLIKAEKVFGAINPLLEGVRIENLPIPYTAVATDITSQREVWFQNGPVEAAIRASIAIPGAFTPVTLRGHVLVDGGLCNPVPVEPTLGVVSDVTIAVSLAGRQTLPAPIDDVPIVERAEKWPLLSRLPFAPRRVESSDEIGEHEPAPETSEEPENAHVGMLELIDQSLDTMQGIIERYRAAANPAQVRVFVPRTAAAVSDFHRASELIDLGRSLAVQAFDEAGL